VRELRTKRIALFKKWNAQWENGAANAPNVERAQRAAAETLAAYTEINEAYEAARWAFMLKLHEEGRKTAANLLASTPEVQRLQKQMFNARRVYLAAKDAVDKAKWSDPSAAEIRNLDELIKVEEQLLEQRRQRQSLAQREYNELRVTYTERMHELGSYVPYKVEGFPMYELLNKPLADLLRELDSRPDLVEALQATMTKWDGFLRDIRRDRDNAAAGAL
jgi:hypothetical protein